MEHERMTRRPAITRHRFPASLVTQLAGPLPEDESVPDGADVPKVFFSALDGKRDPVGVHWHRVEEFQPFVAGSGTMGRHALGPVSIHYADAFVPYGPITPGAEGLTMLTLRARSAQSHWMPATRDALAFRAARRGRFPGAAESERVIEINEGLAQYTATVVAAGSPAEATRNAAGSAIALAARCRNSRRRNVIASASPACHAVTPRRS